MKFFTRKWRNFLCTEEGDDTFERYNAYIDSIRKKFTPGLIELDRAVLHDGHVKNLVINGRNSKVKLVLEGYDWSGSWVGGQPPSATITLTYLRSSHFQVKGHPNRFSTWFNRSDLLNDEIEWIEGSGFEHRMVFCQGSEILVRFEDVIVVKEHAKPAKGTLGT